MSQSHPRADLPIEALDSSGKEPASRGATESVTARDVFPRTVLFLASSGPCPGNPLSPLVTLAQQTSPEQDHHTDGDAEAEKRTDVASGGPRTEGTAGLRTGEAERRLILFLSLYLFPPNIVKQK